MSKNDGTGRVVLIRGKHFSLTALAQHLNDKYGNKPSGAKYTAMDVQKYLTRGHLPEYLGNLEVSSVRDDIIGIKLVILGGRVGRRTRRKVKK